MANFRIKHSYSQNFLKERLFVEVFVSFFLRFYINSIVKQRTEEDFSFNTIIKFLILVLNDRYVLTAAHCLLNAKSVEVHLGAHDRTNVNEEGRLVFNSTEFKAHEKFNILAHNDIGIIKLPESVTFTNRIKPVKLPKNNKDKYEDKYAVVSGWGIEHTGATEVPKEMRFTELKVISNGQCRKEYNFLIVKDTTLCAKGDNKESSCNGDSGGALVLKKTKELIGIVSFVGVEGCEAGLAGGFTRVNKYLDWIRQHSE